MSAAIFCDIAGARATATGIVSPPVSPPPAGGREARSEGHGEGGLGWGFRRDAVGGDERRFTARARASVLPGLGERERGGKRGLREREREVWAREREKKIGSATVQPRCRRRAWARPPSRRPACPPSAPLLARLPVSAACLSESVPRTRLTAREPTRHSPSLRVTGDSGVSAGQRGREGGQGPGPAVRP